jgi:bifunctional non-homologous end joining protein LigD
MALQEYSGRIHKPMLRIPAMKSSKSPKREGKRAVMPKAIAPMLCTLTKAVINDPGYLHEIKWDGYRILSYVQNGKVHLDSRSAIDYTSRYPRVVEALRSLGRNVVIDGEMVVFNGEGMPDFDALQLYNGGDADINYCVFDILWLDGYSLLELPLEERKKILKNLVTGYSTFRFSESFDDGPALYEEMKKQNLEGIVSKRRDSPYVPGERAKNWLKTPTHKRQEFVIGGWAESDKSRAFKSLLFGAYNGKDLEWIGRSGGGYKEKDMPGILKILKSLEIDRSPFADEVLDSKGAKIHWVKPELVANFEFATWTKTGRIRKPATFLGFRGDKKPRQVVREIPKSITAITDETQKRIVSVPKKKAITRSADTKPSGPWRAVDGQNKDRPDTMDVDGYPVGLFNVGREVWKGVPKSRLIEYYHDIAAYILPYLKDRPESLFLKLTNAAASGMYIKDMEGRQPSFAEIFTVARRHPMEGKRSTIDYLICNNEATLLWMVNMGCVDINPWNSRISAPENPDFLAIDLDPTVKDEKSGYIDKLLDTAIAARAWFDKHKIRAFAKTSGRTGIHFFVPCKGFNYPQARTITEMICAGIHDLVPASSTIEHSISERGDLVYVDPSQNDYGDTLAAPYSVRSFDIPMVSTPLEWGEISRRLDPRAFTIDTILPRLKKKGDLFAAVLDKKIAVSNTKLLTSL